MSKDFKFFSTKSLPVQILFVPLQPLISPDGGIGRRAGLKHQWIHFHAGSIPALGTITQKESL